MSTKRIYPNKNHQGIIECEQCGHTKSLDVSSFLHVRKPLKVRCKCGLTFFIVIELRRFHRKQTDLYGKYDLVQAGAQSVIKHDEIYVDDISRGGMSIRTRLESGLRKGDIIDVQFTLDNAKRSEIHRRAIVRNIREGTLGLEFIDGEDYNEGIRTLAFYLTSD